MLIQFDSRHDQIPVENMCAKNAIEINQLFFRQSARFPA